MDKIISIFAFDPAISSPEFARNCQDWGINTAILHPGFFKNADMPQALDKNQIDLWLNLPVFYNPEFLESHPDYYSITSLGRRAIHDWCHFVCPNRQDYLESFIAESAALAAKLQPKMISLDFIRYFVFWEKVNVNGKAEAIEDGCYCPVCLAAFEKSLGEKLPAGNPAQFIRSHVRKDWGQWKSHRITEAAGLIISALRSACPSSQIWIKTVPWKETDMDGAILSSPGQDVPALGKLVDGIAPMAFTHILNQTPAWKETLLAEVKKLTGKPLLSYLQVDKVIRDEEITPQQFENELKQGLCEDYAGIAIFHYEQLVQATEKIRLLKQGLQNN
jgi:hypothetical protein